MTGLTFGILVAAVFVGGALQRVAGMGFAMVVAPFSVLLLAGQQGVVFANLCGAVAGLLLVWPVRRDIDWNGTRVRADGTHQGSRTARWRR